MGHLELSLLGPLQATLDGEPISAFRSDKVRALLVFLALQPGRPHRREALAGLLWPDQAETAALHNLRQSLLRLRTALGDDRPVLPTFAIRSLSARPHAVTLPCDTCDAGRPIPGRQRPEPFH